MKRLPLILAATMIAFTSLSTPCEAGLLNRFLRKLGWGWSDGYNAPTNRHWQQPIHGYHVPYAARTWESRVVPSPHAVPVERQYQVPGTVLPSRIVPPNSTQALPQPHSARPSLPLGR